MVDPIGIKAVNASARITAPSAPTPVGLVRRAAGADEARVAMPGVARTLAASPPVDLDRVARIKQAIADGTFPIYPAKIADRLIALKLDWNPSEQPQ